MRLIEASPPEYGILFSARQAKKGDKIATIFLNRSPALDDLLVTSQLLNI